MIEVQWKDLRDYDLNSALNSLARQKVPYRTTVKILGIVKAVESEQKKADAVAKALQDKYFKTNPDYKPGADVPKLILKDEALRTEAAAAEKEFGETSAKFRFPKITGVELEETTLSAVELFRLEPFIELEEKPKTLKPVEANA